jgi:hypothetical protein
MISPVIISKTQTNKPLIQEHLKSKKRSSNHSSNATIWIQSWHSDPGYIAYGNAMYNINDTSDDAVNRAILTRSRKDFIVMKDYRRIANTIRPKLIRVSLKILRAILAAFENLQFLREKKVLTMFPKT